MIVGRTSPSPTVESDPKFCPPSRTHSPNLPTSPPYSATANSPFTAFYKDRHAYFLAASASLGAIFYGWDIGLIGGVLSLPSFRAYFALDHMSSAKQADLSGNIVSVLQGGCL